MCREVRSCQYRRCDSPQISCTARRPGRATGCVLDAPCPGSEQPRGVGSGPPAASDLGRPAASDLGRPRRRISADPRSRRFVAGKRPRWSPKVVRATVAGSSVGWPGVWPITWTSTCSVSVVFVLLGALAGAGVPHMCCCGSCARSATTPTGPRPPNVGRPTGSLWWAWSSLLVGIAAAGTPLANLLPFLVVLVGAGVVWRSSTHPSPAAVPGARGRGLPAARRRSSADWPSSFWSVIPTWADCRRRCWPSG